MKNSIRRFDKLVTKHILQLPNWVRSLMLFMTLLGQPPITVGLATGVVGFGIARESDRLVMIGLIAILTVAICSLLKMVLRRARPDNDYVRSMLIQTFSFPSGHAAGSLVSFGLAAYIGGIVVPELSIVFIIITAFVSFLIGISRVYLGAHYPSDVIGGWLLGAAGLIGILIAGMR